MTPDWFIRIAAESGPAMVRGWSNLDVVAVAFAMFAILFLVSVIFAADWLGDAAFLTLVTGGLLITWPLMIALTLACVVFAVAVGAVHARVAPGRNARATAAAWKNVAPRIDELARDAGMDEAARRKLLADVDEDTRRR
jgi:hypothetical protein